MIRYNILALKKIDTSGQGKRQSEKSQLARLTTMLSSTRKIFVLRDLRRSNRDRSSWTSPVKWLTARQDSSALFLAISRRQEKRGGGIENTVELYSAQEMECDWSHCRVGVKWQRSHLPFKVRRLCVCVHTRVGVCVCVYISHLPFQTGEQHEAELWPFRIMASPCAREQGDEIDLTRAHTQINFSRRPFWAPTQAIMAKPTRWPRPRPSWEMIMMPNLGLRISGIRTCWCSGLPSPTIPPQMALKLVARSEEVH